MTIDTPHVSARCGAPGLANLPSDDLPPGSSSNRWEGPARPPGAKTERLIDWLDSTIDEGRE